MTKKSSKFNLDNSHHVFVIAEAGSNWKCGTFEEDLKRAKEMINVAVESDADAVKFQTYRPESIYVPNAGQSNYLSKKGISGNIYEIFEHLSMPYEMIPELAKYCDSRKIMFMSTPFSVKDAIEVNPHVFVHKVASYEINHVRLLEFLAKTKKPMIISTGASTYAEIDFAVKLVKKSGNNRISLLQCTSKYPAPIGALNLMTIPEMKIRYNLPVGLSDHSTDPIIGPLVAVGAGATIIEKHFTLDRNLPGPDHPFALIPSELKLMVDSIRMAEQSKGDGIKKILKEEQELRRFATRSIQATKNTNKDEVFKEGYNFDILRPGNQKRGAEARFITKIQGKKACRKIKAGQGILLSDCKDRIL